MTMRFKPNTSISSGSNIALEYLFEFLDFMRSVSPAGPGWSIPRSSNGTTGGAGDNIAAFADLSQYVAGVSESWFVLQEPGGGREYCWFRTSTNDTNWNLSYSPTGVFTGGDETGKPTAADEVTIHANDIIHSTGNSVVHMGADDAAPYGWFLWSSVSGDLTASQAMYMQIPITHSAQPGEADPMVFFYDAGGQGLTLATFTATSDTGTAATVRGSVPGQTAWGSMAACALEQGSTAVFPGGCDTDDNGADIGMPIAFCRHDGLVGPTGFKGLSDFVMWNGFARAAGETFASFSRVSLGVANLPWDGVAAPSSS